MRGDATLPLGVHDRGLVPLSRPMRRRVGGRFGEYDVLTPLARGGMCTVYLAAHEATGARVALKVLEPQFATHAEIRARLAAEHAVASLARHPGLLEISEARMTSDGVPYLVMEYVDGETLGALADRGPIEPSQAVAIVAQVAAALAALHAAGVMHCDVKHDNVLVLAGGGAKVIDFGVSRRIDEEREDTTIAGTPWCMAPEQWRGRPSPASDVYAIGCLLYDLLTGSPPFEGSLPELMTAHLEQRPARPSWLAPISMPLERLILRALAKDPDDRPTMAQLARALETLAEIVPVEELRVA